MRFKALTASVKWIVLIFVLGLFASGSAQGAYLLNQLGAGSITRGEAGWASGNIADNISLSGMSINRTAPGFGDTTTNFSNVIEGVYMQYSFTASSGGAAFDAQISMSGIWSGWGSANNGSSNPANYTLYQYGPTTSNWNRGTRYQHGYPGDSLPAQTSFNGSFTLNDPVVTRNTTLGEPSAGDQLSVTVYLNAITNVLEYEYNNLTTGEVFTYTYVNANIPTSTTLSFGTLSMRSDTPGVTAFSYSYGTLGVVPEPGRAALVLFGACALAFRRKR